MYVNQLSTLFPLEKIVVGAYSNPNGYQEIKYLFVKTILYANNTLNTY